MSALSSSLASSLRLRAGWTTLGAAALVGGTGFAHGGYFPGPWGWTTLAAAWAAGAAILSRERAELSRAGAGAAALLFALAVWTALSTQWSSDVTQSALEAERAAVYASALLACLLWARDRPDRLLRGAWFGITAVCTWSLATRLVPDRWGVIDAMAGYRLSEPLGYWNSLGLFAGMGALLALGLAARARTPLGRALAGASLPPLLTTLYFTYSRGAWIAFGFGLLVLFALDARRTQLAAAAATLAPWSAIAVWRASSYPALTTWGSPLAEMARQGHRMLLVLVTLSVLSAAAPPLLVRVEPRLRLPERWLPAVRVALAVAAVAVIAGAWGGYGSPLDAWRSFASAPPATGSNLNARLFHLSGSGRTTQWRIALDEAQAHPWLGSGAGTFEVWWNRHKPVPGRIRDVHNLYVETLAELGPPGLVLLVAALALPLVAAGRTRARPLTAAAASAYAAYLLHAVVDWDWEIAAVTLAAIVCAAVLLAGTRARLLLGASRTAALAAAVVLGAAGIYTIATRIPIDRLNAALADGRAADAVRQAKEASALAPWSSEPWLLLGEAELNAGATGDAWGHLRTAAEKDPENWVAWWDLARASVGVERTHALAEARRLNPLAPELKNPPPRP